MVDVWVAELNLGFQTVIDRPLPCIGFIEVMPFGKQVDRVIGQAEVLGFIV